MYSKRLICNQFMSFVQGKMLAFVIFCSRILFSKDSCHTNQLTDLNAGQLIGFYWFY